MMIRTLLVTIASMLIATSAHAQIVQDKVWDALSPEVRKLATGVFALVPDVSPNGCLSLGTDDPRKGFQAGIVKCYDDWTSTVAVDPINGDVSNGTVRISNLARGCLVSVGADEAPRWLSCDTELPTAWTIKGRQLVDRFGKCLQASPLGENRKTDSNIVACDASNPGQNWRVESFSTAVARNGTPYKIPGANDHFWFELPGVVEQLRPRFQERKLTPAERQEIKALVAPHARYNMVEVLYGKALWPAFNDQKVPWATLSRLMQLGESGDREAMKAVVDLSTLALLAGGYKGEGGTIFDAIEGEYAAPGDPLIGRHDSAFGYQVLLGLNRLWSAHYWQKHGPDRVAARGLFLPNWGPDLHPGNQDFMKKKGFGGGFSYDDSPDSKTSLKDYYEQGVRKWAVSGKKDHFRTLRDFKFFPMGIYPADVLSKRFVDRLNLMGTPSFAKNWELHKVYDYMFLHYYSNATGRGWLFENVYTNLMLKIDLEQEHSSSPVGSIWGLPFSASGRMRYAHYYWALKTELAELMRIPAPSEQQIGRVRYKLGVNAPEQILEFAERFPVEKDDQLAVVCAPGRESTSACQRSQAHMQRLSAQRAEEVRQFYANLAAEEQKRAAEMARNEERWRNEVMMTTYRRQQNRKPGLGDFFAALITGFAGGAAAASQPVQVRSYDQNGNYTGSYTTIRGIADAEGAR